MKNYYQVVALSLIICAECFARIKMFRTSEPPVEESTVFSAKLPNGVEIAVVRYAQSAGVNLVFSAYHWILLKDGKSRRIYTQVGNPNSISPGDDPVEILQAEIVGNYFVTTFNQGHGRSPISGCWAEVVELSVQGAPTTKSVDQDREVSRGTSGMPFNPAGPRMKSAKISFDSQGIVMFDGVDESDIPQHCRLAIKKIGNRIVERRWEKADLPERPETVPSTNPSP